MADAAALRNEASGDRERATRNRSSATGIPQSIDVDGSSAVHVPEGRVRYNGKTFRRTGDDFESRRDAVVAGAHHALRQSWIVEWGWIVYRVGRRFGFIWFEGGVLGTDFGDVPDKVFPVGSILVATGHTHPTFGLPPSPKDLAHSRKLKKVFGAAMYITGPNGTYLLLPNGDTRPVAREKETLQRLKRQGLVPK